MTATFSPMSAADAAAFLRAVRLLGRAPHAGVHRHLQTPTCGVAVLLFALAHSIPAFKDFSLVFPHAAFALRYLRRRLGRFGWDHLAILPAGWATPGDHGPVRGRTTADTSPLTRVVGYELVPELVHRGV